MLVECGGKLWANEARGKSWDWAGHVLRMSEDRWPRQVLDLKPTKLITRVVQTNGVKLSSVVTVLPGELEIARPQGTGNRSWLQPMVRHIRVSRGQLAAAPRLQGQRRIDFENDWFHTAQECASDKRYWKDSRASYCSSFALSDTSVSIH